MAALSKHEIKTLRFLAKKKFSKAREMLFPSRAALEQATPEEVAMYRAARIGDANAVAADLCCGIGMDAIALAKHCRKVYAIDIDSGALECARENAKAYGARNMEFICSDYRKINLRGLGAGIIFADPSRRAGKKRVKDLHETAPSTTEIIEFARKAGAKGFCVEVSNALPLEKLPGECEKEFISLNHEPNCITLYFGGLKKCNFSAVALPQNERVEADLVENISGGAGKLGGYLFELDESIKAMRLQGALLGKIREGGAKARAFEEGFLTADEMAESAFFRNSFRVLAVVEKGSDVIGKLNELGAGKVVLRAALPEGRHAAMKGEIEAQLRGREKLHLFYFKSCIAVCKNVAF